MRIFAYGSNMNIERLKKRTPSAFKVSNASIQGLLLRCIYFSMANNFSLILLNYLVY